MKYNPENMEKTELQNWPYEVTTITRAEYALGIRPPIPRITPISLFPDPMTETTVQPAQIRRAIELNQIQNQNHERQETIEETVTSNPNCSKCDKFKNDLTWFRIRFGLVCAGFIFSTFALILLPLVWPECSTPDLILTCHSSHCHAMSAKILESLNMSSKPCLDFWEFSCGGWLDSNPIPKSKGIWSADSKEQFDVKNRMRSLVNTKEILPDPYSVDLKLKRFYDSCMAIQQIETDGDSLLQNIISHLGGWEPLKTFRMNDFDFQRLLKKIHSEYRANPFFHVDVVPDPKWPSHNIIRISPAGISLPSKSFYKNTTHKLAILFKTYAKDIMQSLGSTTVSAAAEAEEIFEYEGKIADAIPEDGLDLEISSPGSWKRIRVDKLKYIAPVVFWGDVLRALFPGITIADDTNILVTSLDYFRGLSLIISASQNRTLNTYLIWQLVNKYVSYMSKQFKASHESFHTQATGRKEGTPRWEFCIDETLAVFSPVLNSWLSEDSAHNGDVTQVEQMFGVIQKSFYSQINSSSIVDVILKEWALNKVSSMKLQVGGGNMERTELIEFYTPLYILPNEFFKNVLSAEAFALQVLLKYLKPGVKKFPPLPLLSPHNHFFIPFMNGIMIPEPELHTNQLFSQHKSILYGTIGVKIGEMMVNWVWSEMGLHPDLAAKGRTETIEILMNLTGYSRDVDCLPLTSANLSSGEIYRIEKTSLESIIHKIGIDIALNGMRSTGSQNLTSLPSLKVYDHNHMFFISYAQTQCSSRTKEFRYLESSTHNGFNQEERVKSIRKESKTFKEVFQCGKAGTAHRSDSCYSINQ